MIEGKLKSGFAYQIEDHVLDNMELLDAIGEVDQNPIYMSKVLKMLLGDEQKKALYNHLRTEHGNVPIAAISDAITEIFGNSQVKN